MLSFLSFLLLWEHNYTDNCGEVGGENKNKESKKHEIAEVVLRHPTSSWHGSNKDICTFLNLWNISLSLPSHAISNLSLIYHLIWIVLHTVLKPVCSIHYIPASWNRCMPFPLGLEKIPLKCTGYTLPLSCYLFEASMWAKKVIIHCNKTSETRDICLLRKYTTFPQNARKSKYFWNSTPSQGVLYQYL